MCTLAVSFKKVSVQCSRQKRIDLYNVWKCLLPDIKIEHFSKNVRKNDKAASSVAQIYKIKFNMATTAGMQWTVNYDL